MRETHAQHTSRGKFKSHTTSFHFYVMNVPKIKNMNVTFRQVWTNQKESVYTGGKWQSKEIMHPYSRNIVKSVHAQISKYWEFATESLLEPTLLFEKALALMQPAGDASPLLCHARP